jgi:hypothetical protein
MNGAQARGLILALVFLLCGSSTLAHSIPVYLEFKLAGPNLEMSMTDPDGLPIVSADIAYLLQDAKGRVTQKTFDEAKAGLYTTPKPDVQPGKYTFTVRDTTFNPELLEVSKKLVWPPIEQFDLILPASTVGISTGMGILIFMGGPILLVGGLILWAMRGQKKREQEEGRLEPELESQSVIESTENAAQN